MARRSCSRMSASRLDRGSSNSSRPTPPTRPGPTPPAAARRPTTRSGSAPTGGPGPLARASPCPAARPSGPPHASGAGGTKRYEERSCVATKHSPGTPWPGAGVRAGGGYRDGRRPGPRWRWCPRSGARCRPGTATGWSCPTPRARGARRRRPGQPGGARPRGLPSARTTLRRRPARPFPPWWPGSQATERHPPIRRQPLGASSRKPPRTRAISKKLAPRATTVMAAPMS